MTKDTIDPPKPTAPEPEYESVPLEMLCDGTVRKATGTVGLRYGIGRFPFPKPATCPTCGQTKKVAV